MKAIVTVIGKDRVGIIAKVSKVLAENMVNIMDISQTILQDYFAMIMLVDLTDMKLSFSDLSQETGGEGENHRSSDQDPAGRRSFKACTKIVGRIPQKRVGHEL